jgi:hypothetical protein
VAAVELFANQPSTTVSSGGTTAPSPGAVESWTVASSSSFPAASNSAVPPAQFHVADTASGKISEIIAVTNVSGTTWTVTRGAESTTPVAHTAGFTVQQVVSAGGLGSLLSESGSTMNGYLAPKVVTLTDGSSVALDASGGNAFSWALGASSHTLAAPSNPVDGQVIRVRIKYGGSYTPLFNAVFDFGAGGQPSWTATSGKTDIAGFEYDASLNAGAGEWAYLGSVLGLTS